MGNKRQVATTDVVANHQQPISPPLLRLPNFHRFSQLPPMAASSPHSDHPMQHTTTSTTTTEQQTEKRRAKRDRASEEDDGDDTPERVFKAQCKRRRTARAEFRAAKKLGDPKKVEQKMNQLNQTYVDNGKRMNNLSEDFKSDLYTRCGMCIARKLLLSTSDCSQPLMRLVWGHVQCLDYIWKGVKVSLCVRGIGSFSHDHRAPPFVEISVQDAASDDGFGFVGRHASIPFALFGHDSRGRGEMAYVLVSHMQRMIGEFLDFAPSHRFTWADDDSEEEEDDDE